MPPFQKWQICDIMEPIFIFLSHNCAEKALTGVQMTGESTSAGEEDGVAMLGR
jgi:hypothetical protein